MEAPSDPTRVRVAATLDQEMQLLREAIVLVGTGTSRRVVLASIQFGELLIEPAQQEAAAAGVRLVPLWSLDEGTFDIAVERADE